MPTGASMPFFAWGVEEAASGRKITVLTEQVTTSEGLAPSADLQMLWLLVKAAREFIASLYLREIPAADAANAAKAAVCEFLGTPRVRLRP